MNWTPARREVPPLSPVRLGPRGFGSSGGSRSGLAARRGPPLATRVLAQLSTMRLSSFDASTGALGRRIMALLKDTPASDVALTADCVKLLNNLLKRHAAFAPTDAQFRFICQRCFGDLEGDLNPMLRSGGATRAAAATGSAPRARSR